jgi:hypothetical protein
MMAVMNLEGCVILVLELIDGALSTAQVVGIAEVTEEFYILLTVHFDAILVNEQLDALFFNLFILCLYMFRTTSAHHQEG